MVDPALGRRAGQVLEIGRSVAIADDAVEAVRSFAAAAGWTPVVFTKNEAGELNYPPMERKY